MKFFFEGLFGIKERKTEERKKKGYRKGTRVKSENRGKEKYKYPLNPGLMVHRLGSSTAHGKKAASSRRSLAALAHITSQLLVY